MPSKIRMQRISDRIRNELSEMLVKEVQDPRLSGISVTDVRVDRELAYADVYVSAVEGHERSREVLEGLHSASGFLRHALSLRVDLRVFPRLRFHWDPTPERADHIERVLASIRDETPVSENPAAIDGEDIADDDEATQELDLVEDEEQEEDDEQRG
jgi:ribosome-binding factor A